MGTLKDHLIVAIDTADITQAQVWVATLSPHVAQFKIGLEFFVVHGAEGVRLLAHHTDKRFFLDLKLHDIPATVSETVRKLRMPVKMLTVHASGGVEMMKVARQSADIDIIAVTMLTHLTDRDLVARGNVAWTALQLADDASIANVGGVVCSPWEVQQMKARVSPGMKLITPGIRSKGVPTDDHKKRAMTAYEAVSRGADYVVVGRPITRAPDPVEAVIALAAEFEAERQAV